MKTKLFLSFLFSLTFITCLYAQNADFYTKGQPQNYMVPIFNESGSALTTATWASIASSPHAVSRSCCCFVRRNDTDYVFQFGGGASASQYTNVAVYIVSSNTWVNNVSTMPQQVSAGYAIPDGDSVIYVFGGLNTAGLGKTQKWRIWGAWTTLTDMPTPATDMLCVKYQDTLVYAICGGDGLFGATVNNAVRLFRMRSATWTALTAFPVSKSMVGGGIYADTIIVTGGWTGSSGSPLTHKGVINPANPQTITWTTLPNYPTGGVTRMANHTCLRPNQGVGVVCSGGAIDGSTVTAATNFWNFCTGAWQTLPNSTLARSNYRGCGRVDSVFYGIAGYTTAGTGTSDKLTFSQIDGNCALTGIWNNNNSVPSGFALAQNFPNPFNPTTTIYYHLPVTSDVKIVITDVLGREVASLVNSRMSAGVQFVEFDASELSSGIYFYTITAGDFKDTKKMMLIK